MFPYKDDNPTKTFPYITIGLIVLNVAVFIYEIYLGEKVDSFISNFGSIPVELLSFTNLAGSEQIPPIASIFTSMFLHGGWLHIIGNMLYLWIFGDNIEDNLGHFKFLGFYLGCGFFASAAHFIFNIHSAIPTIGASGAIAGILGAYFILFPKARVHVLIPIIYFIKIIKIPAFIVLGFWFFIQVINSLPSPGMPNDSKVAWLAHIGGFVVGVILIIILGKKPKDRRKTYRF